MARTSAVAALFLVGCLGPILPLPRYPHTVHAWACANLACPAEADRVHGLAKGAKYNADERLCECWIEDIRHLDIYTLVDPHKKAP